MRLTIGMATYDDFDGVYFTLQSLRLHHDLRDVELLVVDNNPGGPHGEMTRGLVEQWISPRQPARYIAMPEPKGTAAPRQRLFDEAAGDVVLCLDPHVLLDFGALAALRRHFDADPNSRDLVSGPMLMDNLNDVATHFEPVWRGEMFGVWATDPRGTSEDEPFEVPGQGLGAFAMRKAAWPGFNPAFRGFGGEELYIHAKVKRAGGRNLCLPWFRWLHRFGRPAGVPYHFSLYGKVRNYIIGHRELGWSLEPIRQHFVVDGKLPEETWAAMIESDVPPEAPVVDLPLKPANGTPACGSCSTKVPDSLEQWYTQARDKPSDINEHVPTLRSLASQCRHVTEFGVRRGVSTVALLAGQPGRLVSYDLNTAPEVSGLKDKRGNCEFEFRQGDSRLVEIEPTDMLFIDTRHTAEHLRAELANAAGKVRRWIALHDTEIFGERGEDGSDGLLVALREFMRANPEWSVIRHDANNHGFTVLSRDSADKPTLPGVVSMGWNFLKAVTGRALSKEGRLPLAIAEERLKVCDTCEKRVGEQCSICGCYLAEGPGGIDGRAFYPNLDCPAGKWPKAVTEKAA